MGLLPSLLYEETTQKFNLGNNTIIGATCGVENTTGENNTYIGNFAGRFGVTGSRNTFIGQSAGQNTLTDDNSFLGYFAGSLNNTGSSNLCIGASTTFNIAGPNNRIVIGQGVLGDRDGAFFTTLNTKASVSAPVEWNSSTKEMFATSSSLRFKEVVGPYTGDNQKFQQLHPVRYLPKGSRDGRVRTGLLAEELAELFPEFVVFEEDNRTPLSIGYSYMVVLMINQLKKLDIELKELKNRI